MLKFTIKKKKASAEKGCKEERSLKDLFSFDSSKLENTVARDWTVLFFLFVIIFILLFLWSIIVFRGTFSADRGNGSANATSGETTINQADLQKVVKEYGEKEATFEALLTTPPTTTDPSI